MLNIRQQHRIPTAKSLLNSNYLTSIIWFVFRRFWLTFLYRRRFYLCERHRQTDNSEKCIFGRPFSPFHLSRKQIIRSTEAPLVHNNKTSTGLATLIQANKETIIYYSYCTESLGSVESVEDFKINSASNSTKILHLL